MPNHSEKSSETEYTENLRNDNSESSLFAKTPMQRGHWSVFKFKTEYINLSYVVYVRCSRLGFEQYCQDLLMPGNGRVLVFEM